MPGEHGILFATKDSSTNGKQSHMAQQAITGDMLVGQEMALFLQAVDAFYEQGMGCIGCPASQAESINDASAVHGLNPLDVVAALNAKLQ